jgi:hypothetical protein
VSRADGPGNLGGGREAENTLSAHLVEALHDVGIPSARFERIFTVRKGGREVSSKPDVTFSNGGIHVVSAKWGERNELKSITSAWEYREDLGPTLQREGTTLGEVFALTYPSRRGEKFILHLLPRPGRRDLCLRLSSLESVAERLKAAVEGLVEELAQQQEPILEEARRLLSWGAEDLSKNLGGVSDVELEEVFGGHDFFESVLKSGFKGKTRHEGLRRGAAYLFVNQVLFYVLVSQAAEAVGGQVAADHPPIKPEDFSSPDALRAKYFERVHSRNYEPIYGFDVARFFRGAETAAACSELVRGVLGLAPKLDVPDLIGQVFQNLIPFGIRKRLGANYTNRHAAELLARLAVRDWEDSVLDPACGSGTLLVAAYRRKAEFAGKQDQKTIHHRFLEKDITGIEAMALAAHLAAVNLALQQPLVETTHVRIGVADSTAKRPDGSVNPTEVTLPREMRQRSLEMEPPPPRPQRPTKRVVELKKETARPIDLHKVDLVMMNPPFTSWHHMTRTYRESLRMSFARERSAFGKIVRGKFSQQGFFLMLGDDFLDVGGTLATVLPLSTFTAVAFKQLTAFILASYTVETIVVSFGRAALSEKSSVTECLFVARKGAPPPGHRFQFVGVRKHPDDWTHEDIVAVAETCKTGKESPGVSTVVTVTQEDVITGRATIGGLLHRLQPAFAAAKTLLSTYLKSSKVVVVPWGEFRKRRNLPVHRWVLGSELLSFYGPKALFVSRSEQRAQNENDRLVFDRDQETFHVFRDLVTGGEYRFPKSQVATALRRFSFLTSFHVEGQTDFVIVTPGPELEEVMRAFYAPKDAELHLRRIRQKAKGFVGGRWVHRVLQGSARLNMGIRFNLAAPGTTMLACRDDSPVFLAGYGFMIKGLSEREEKLFCLWVNSSLFLTQALERMTPTQGTWCVIQKSFVDKIVFPDFEKLSESDWKTVERTYDELSIRVWPSLMNQLKGDRSRVELDSAMLELVGISSKSDQIGDGAKLRSGILDSLEALRGTMSRTVGDGRGRPSSRPP